MLAFCLAALSMPTIDPPPQRPTDEIQSAGDLYNAYRWYGLPLPPRFSKPVQWRSFHVVLRTSNDGQSWERESRHHFGWLIEPATDRRLARVLDWRSRTDCFHHHGNLQKTTNETLDEFHKNHADWDAANFAFIAGLWHLNERESAKRLFALWQKDQDRSVFDPLQTLRHVAWESWTTEMYGTQSHFSAIHDYLHRIAFEDLSDERELLNRYHGLRESLRLSIESSVRNRGLPSDLIDRLTEHPGRGLHYTDGSYLFETPAGLKVFDFESVPYLIARLDDERMTRHVRASGGGIGPVSVGDLCREVLIDLSHHKLDWNSFIDKSPDERRQYVEKNWFTAANAIGEEEWCMSARNDRNHWSPSASQIAILQVKYPHRLPEMAEECLKQNHSSSMRRILSAVMQSTLPKEIKMRTVERVLTCPDEEMRYAALVALRQHDRAALKPALLRCLEVSLPVSLNPDKGYEMIGSLGILCVDVDDFEVWTAFEKTLPCLHPTIRNYVNKQIMDTCEETGRQPRTMTEPIRMLLRALNESSLDERPASIDFSWNHREYQSLSVRNYAALKLAWVFEIEIDYKPNRTPEEWAAIRKDLQTRAEEHLYTQSK